MNSRIRIGNLLVEAGIISMKTLERALTLQKGSGKRLGALLREMGIVTEEEVIEVLARQCNLKIVRKFADLQFPKDLLELVPQRLASDRLIFPLKRYEGILAVAVLDPFDQATMNILKESTGLRIYPVLATRNEICSAISNHYGAEKRDSARGKRILIVEPSQVMTKMYESALVREGFEVLLAADGIAGLKVAFVRHPDLILCDRHLSRMDSLNFINALKSHPETAPVPVILMSSKLSKEEEKSALNAGFNDFIGKPATPMHLVVRVKEVLSTLKAAPLSPEEVILPGEHRGHYRSPSL